MPASKASSRVRLRSTHTSDQTTANARVVHDDKISHVQLVFGKNLRAARLERGLRQADLAELTGLPQQHLSLIEAGQHNVTLRSMVLLSEVVGRSVSELLIP